MPLAFTTWPEVRFIESHHGLPVANCNRYFHSAARPRAPRKHAAGFYGEDSKAVVEASLPSQTLLKSDYINNRENRRSPDPEISPVCFDLS